MQISRFLGYNSQNGSGNRRSRGSTLADVRDLDFLVRFRPMPPVEYAHNYFRLAEQIEALFEAPVDLVELDSIRNPHFKEAVDETKVPAYEIA